MGAGNPGGRDGDGVTDDIDNCPENYNPDQADNDDDTVGTVCDNCPALSNTGQEDDDDGDGLCADDDNCPDIANVEQADQDGDPVGGACAVSGNTDLFFDDTLVSPGLGFFYIVTATSCENGSLGTDSDAVERTNLNPSACT